MKIQESFLCPTCSSKFEAAPLAMECCIYAYFDCPKCLWAHEDLEAARNCCANDLTPVYICPQCDVIHETEGDAMVCCSDKGEIKS